MSEIYLDMAFSLREKSGLCAIVTFYTSGSAMIIKRQKPREGSAYATYAHQRRPSAIQRFVYLAYKVLCYLFWAAVGISGVLGISLLL